MTLGIYSMQQIVIIYLCNNVTMPYHFNQWIATIMIASFTTLICYHTFLILSKNKVIAFWLFGCRRRT